jgi:hypothetical protein
LNNVGFYRKQLLIWRAFLYFSLYMCYFKIIIIIKISRCDLFDLQLALYGIKISLEACQKNNLIPISYSQILSINLIDFVIITLT